MTDDQRNASGSFLFQHFCRACVCTAAVRDVIYDKAGLIPDREGIFKIGVATSQSPAGSFEPERLPIIGSYRIDPTAFKDAGGAYYLYFGGIQGGQLQHWDNNTYHGTPEPRNKDSAAILPRIARLRCDHPAREEMVPVLSRYTAIRQKSSAQCQGDGAAL